jgi:hypothetical protein
VDKHGGVGSFVCFVRKIKFILLKIILKISHGYDKKKVKYEGDEGVFGKKCTKVSTI